MNLSKHLQELDLNKYQLEEELVYKLVQAVSISQDIKNASFEDAKNIVIAARKLGRPVGVLETFFGRIWLNHQRRFGAYVPSRRPIAHTRCGNCR